MTRTPFIAGNWKMHKLVAEGSIRAATGMLYLAVILAFSAEFAAKARFFS